MKFFYLAALEIKVSCRLINIRVLITLNDSIAASKLFYFCEHVNKPEGSDSLSNVYI